MRERDAEVVWSSSGGDRRRGRGRDARPATPQPSPAGGRVKVRREVAGRRLRIHRR